MSALETTNIDITAGAVSLGMMLCNITELTIFWNIPLRAKQNFKQFQNKKFNAIWNLRYFAPTSQPRDVVLSKTSIGSRRYRPISQIRKCTSPISHNTPFRTEMCTFLFWMEHCGIWDWCIAKFVNLVYSHLIYNTSHKICTWFCCALFWCGYSITMKSLI